MNRLKFSENKTKLMQINMNNELVFKIKNQVIEAKPSTKLNTLDL